MTKPVSEPQLACSNCFHRSPQENRRISYKQRNRVISQEESSKHSPDRRDYLHALYEHSSRRLPRLKTQHDHYTDPLKTRVSATLRSTLRGTPWCGVKQSYVTNSKLGITRTRLTALPHLASSRLNLLSYITTHSHCVINNLINPP